MTALWKPPRRAPPKLWRLVGLIRNIAGLLGAWRQRRAANRELSKLSDRLLRDIGVDGLQLRELARLEELGLPSRNLAAAEIAQGVPVRESPPVDGRSARRSGILQRAQVGTSKGLGLSCPCVSPLSEPMARGVRRAAAAPIRLVPPGGFQA